MNLKDKLIKLRKDNNLTQEELAEKLYVSRQTVSNWENGKFYPDIETLILISNTFNISLDILLKNDKEMVKTMDKKLKSHKKLKIILVIFSIIFILTIFIGYRYHENHKIINKISIINIPENNTVISIKTDRINNDNISYYINKNIDIYIDDHDINAKETKPVVKNAKIIKVEKNFVTITMLNDDYYTINTYIINGYNFEIELSN